MPGDFLPETKTTPSQEYLQDLRRKVGELAPVPTSRHGESKVTVPTSLAKSKYVFVRRGPRTGPLDTPYTGPYTVLRPGNKYFVLDIGGRQETVSVDRLKVAHTVPGQDVTVTVAATSRTPTGKIVKQPKANATNM